jgi:hypothetical protein
MGSNMAMELADKELFPNITLEDAIGMHLRGNHYPPVPLSMVPVCIEAIDAFNEGDASVMVKLPEGVSWRGQLEAPAYAIIEAHHLDAWLQYDMYEAFDSDLF